MLGPDRFKHLNNAADDVLVSCGYKETPKLQKEKKTKKEKKFKKKK